MDVYKQEEEEEMIKEEKEEKERREEGEKKKESLVLIVSGDRDWKDEEALRRVLNVVVGSCLEVLQKKIKEVVLIHGGCRGVDKLFEKVFRELFISIQVSYSIKTYSAEWDLYGKKAGILRNEEMFRERLNFAYHLILIFHDDLFNKSRGTKHMYQLCEKEQTRQLQHRSGKWREGLVYFAHFLSRDSDSLINTKLLKLHHPLSL